MDYRLKISIFGKTTFQFCPYRKERAILALEHLNLLYFTSQQGVRQSSEQPDFTRWIYKILSRYHVKFEFSGQQLSHGEKSYVYDRQTTCTFSELGLCAIQQFYMRTTSQNVQMILYLQKIFLYGRSLVLVQVLCIKCNSLYNKVDHSTNLITYQSIKMFLRRRF